MELRMGHRRLASVAARSLSEGEPISVVMTWRDATSVEIGPIDVGDVERRVAAVAAALQRAHGDGAEYAVALVASNDADAIQCLLRVGFEPELAGPGHEAAWERLLVTESGGRGLL
jgi:hypothetical protein